MYIFIDEQTILPYNNEVLKRYVGQRLVKAISNPTEQQLLEFGYMPMEEDPEPEYDEQTQYLTVRYAVQDGTIHKQYEVQEIEAETPIAPETEQHDSLT